MSSSAKGNYILGLDIGASSIGWSLIGATGGKPASLIRCGARVFDAGMEEGDFAAGKENSRNAARRQARQARRLTDRRARRKARLFHLLQKAGLLPAGEPATILPALDAQLRARYIAPLPRGSPERARLEHTLPYRLRARALSEKLEPHEIGRAIYHLAQRRGFLSNRKAPPRKDEDIGKVRGSIRELEKRMKEADALTLGQYFAGLDPMEERIRRRWTSRPMYLAEFGLVWAAQAPHYPDILTEETGKRICRAIFHQRPLKSAAGLIGTCEFEPGRRRAPVALLLAQRFRMLQQVTDTRILAPGGQSRYLTAQERDALLDLLERQGDLSFAKARRALGLPRHHCFNWESGGEKRFLGNRTNAKLVDIFGDRWWSLSETERNQIVEDALSIQKEEALARRGERRWGLDKEAAKRLGQLALEDGYIALSRRALAKLVPMLEDGVPYSTAVKEAYGERRTDPVDQLPPPVAAYPHLRNPMVTRVLAELRKIVNAVTRQYGKPAAVRVELARDMRKSRKQRGESWKLMRQNERARQRATERIAAEAGIQNPSRSDTEKVLLAQECNWQCPYTGRNFGMNDLVGPTPQVDVEHIIPFSRCLDDSFYNKTICEIRENRDIKGNRTPFEAYGQSDKWPDILQRVRAFKGRAAADKLRRFEQQEIESIGDFTARQLNDTRYAARQATDYLALLYGGLYETGGVRRIQATKGGVTAYLRDRWQLNSILGDGGLKSRDDHRHHAVDAITIALTDPGAVKMLADAADRAERSGTRWWRQSLDHPWPGFLDDVREAIAGVVVSHRVSRKINGPLHEETHYSPAGRDANGTPAFFAVRKPLAALSKSDIRQIVDDRVRKLVEEKLAALGGDPDKAFADAANHPFLTAKDGRRIPIHSVRVRKPETAMPIGQGARLRHVLSGSNHHMEIFAVKDAKGRTRCVGRVVSCYEAMRRLAKRLPVVDRTPPDGGRFLFSLGSGEIVELKNAEGRTARYRIRTVSQAKSGSIEIAGARLTDARLKKEIMTSGNWLRITSLDDLIRMACRKVTVTPLGEVRYAND